MVYRNSRDLPRIGFAVMQAEGFVTVALPRLFASRRRPKPVRTCAHTHVSAKVPVQAQPEREVQVA